MPPVLTCQHVCMNSPLITESAALRACNLPDTPHWRNWLREKCSPQEISTGRVYDGGLVDHLAAKIRPLAGNPAPAPQREAPTGIQFSAPVDSGRLPRTERQLQNRIAPDLHTR